MQLEAKHYALLGAFLVAIGAQLSGLTHGWADAVTPGFMGGLIGEFGLMVGALYVGAPGASQALAQAQSDTLAVASGAVKIEGVDVKAVPKIPTVPAVLLAIGLAAGGGMVMIGCASPASIVTVPGQQAFKADQIVQRLGEISAIVRADTGNQPGQIRPADAFLIISSISGDAHGNPPSIGIAQMLQTATASGGKVALQTWWSGSLRGIFGRYAKLADYLPIIDAIVGGL